ncbi:MAG: HD domain-containing protein, partial [Chitinophagaceae bacterium]|nr:HD domain-containing protein [Chitinophagaceae bacterium]
MDYNGILSGIAHFVEKTFVESGKLLPYHNLEHTRNVVAAASELSGHYQLNEEETFIVKASAWFHDLGVTDGPLEGHEKRSAALAENWLNEQNADGNLIDQIVRACEDQHG